MCYNPSMSKNFLNKNQKRILYKNMGFLLALTVLCAVLARRITDSRGETLQELAERQEQEAVDSASAEEETSEYGSSSDGPAGEAQTSAAEDTLPSDDKAGSSPGEPSQAADDTQNPTSESDSGENASAPEEGEHAMADRTIWRDGFYYESLSDTVKKRITGISYPADDSSAAISYDTLRYVKVLYYDFDDEIQTGELICHKAIAQDLVEIFYELYEAHYPIERITLIDDYQGDDELSMQDNNTSCFNYRTRPSGSLSNHAYGLAVDLNPFYNPYVAVRDDGSLNIAPAGSESYADRDQVFDYKIDKDDLACRLFIEHGFTWGGSWRSVKDYQHFEKEI